MCLAAFQPSTQPREPVDTLHPLVLEPVGALGRARPLVPLVAFARLGLDRMDPAGGAVLRNPAAFSNTAERRRRSGYGAATALRADYSLQQADPFVESIHRLKFQLRLKESELSRSLIETRRNRAAKVPAYQLLSLQQSALLYETRALLH